jgi:hypothetical protein
MALIWSKVRAAACHSTKEAVQHWCFGAWVLGCLGACHSPINMTVRCAAAGTDEHRHASGGAEREARAVVHVLLQAGHRHTQVRQHSCSLNTGLTKRSRSTQQCRWSVTVSSHALQEPAERARGQEARQQRQLARRTAHARHCRPLAGQACSGFSMSTKHAASVLLLSICVLCTAFINALHTPNQGSPDAQQTAACVTHAEAGCMLCSTIARRY